MLQAVKDLPALRRWYYTLSAPVKVTRLRLPLESAVRRNRRALAAVSSWIDEDVYQASVFRYGLPPHIRPFIDDPIDESPSYSDLIVHLAMQMGHVRYLELGPSVGKNFFQVAKAVSNAELVAIDIENINPVLERQLTFVGREEWESARDSIRTERSTQTTYTLESNRIDYIAGDLFDRSTWNRLVGRKFNVIFSDAFHSPQGLATEWERILQLELLCDGPVALIWDDLGHAAMRRTFYEIAVNIRQLRPGAQVSLELLQGWVGKRERLHPVGIIRA